MEDPNQPQEAQDHSIDHRDQQSKSLVDRLKYHVVDSTALLASTHPLFSAFETGVSQMSDDVSIKSRLYITGLTYLGLGWVVAQGRNLSRRIFHITDKTKETVQYIHDSLYMAAINLPLGVGLYMAAGETDPKKIAVGTGIAMAMGLGVGPWAGYWMDVGEDLAGLKECERKTYPGFVKRQEPKVKRGIAAALLAASVGIMSIIYAVTPDRAPEHQPEPPAQEQVVAESAGRHDHILEERVIEAEYHVNKCE